MSPEVLNRKTLRKDERGRYPSPVDAVYVGRPSKWGNPFTIAGTQHLKHLTDEQRRASVISMFKDWFENSPDSPIGDIEELRGKDLICWCAPLPCHADILLEEANK